MEGTVLLILCIVVVVILIIITRQQCQINANKIAADEARSSSLYVEEKNSFHIDIIRLNDDRICKIEDVLRKDNPHLFNAEE